jgi:7-cyano-7-deazaguanine synthase in queuosine biosynthesis
VLCDDATHPKAPKDALRLTLGTSQQSMTVDIHGIDSALTGRLSAPFVDLIRIAALVLGVDGAVTRGRLTDDDSGERWHRRFRLVVGVDDPSFWNQQELRRALEETLGFLSQDTFVFEFQHRQKEKPHQLVFSRSDGKSFLPWDHIDEVSLFSGGLDSFAGAAELILERKRGTVLVSHLSASKTRHTQTSLVEDLRTLAKANGCPAPVHVVMEVTRHDERLRKEHTQRTRSFLYAAITGAVASLIGRSRACMYENGIVAINLPIAGSVVGSRATRTAHPLVLSGFSRILSHVAGRAMTVKNPFLLKTRGEVIRGLASSPALPLAKRTVSCAHVHKGTNMHPHCGVCSQCIDRQFGFLGAGMEQHDSALGYATQLASDEWSNESARRLLLSWIDAADRYAACRGSVDFLGSFGEAARAVPFVMEANRLDADAAARAVYELHKRHGDAVAAVLAAIASRSAQEVRAGKLKPDTLPMLVYQEGLRKGGHDDRRGTPLGIENQVQRTASGWSIRFRNGSAFAVPDSKGMLYLGTLLGAPGSVRTAAGLVAMSEGHEPTASVTLTARGVKAVQAHIVAIEKERDQAQEFCDMEGAQRCQAEIDSLRAICASRSTGRRSADKIVLAVEDEIRQVLAVIAERNAPLHAHLVAHLQIGAVFWYRGTGLAWDVVSSIPLGDSDVGWVSASDLVDPDVHFLRTPRDVRRFCEQQHVPTRPGKTKDGRDHPRRLMVNALAFASVGSRVRPAQVSAGSPDSAGAIQR